MSLCVEKKGSIRLQLSNPASNPTYTTTNSHFSLSLRLHFWAKSSHEHTCSIPAYGSRPRKRRMRLSQAIRVCPCSLASSQAHSQSVNQSVRLLSTLSPPCRQTALACLAAWPAYMARPLASSSARNGIHRHRYNNAAPDAKHGPFSSAASRQRRNEPFT